MNLVVKQCKRCKEIMGACEPNDSIHTADNCNGELETLNISRDELSIIEDISTDESFVQAMIDLKEKDIIEYNLKMSQFKSQLEQQKSNKVQNDNTPRCPNCNSTNIKSISALNRSVSIVTLGVFSKKINKSFECLNCKYTW